jgi:hypothetical protein
VPKYILGVTMADFLQSLQNNIFGTQGQFKQAPRFTPQQSGVLNQNVLPAIAPLLQQLQQRQGQGFEPIAQKARSQFNTQTIPSLAERFTSLGGQRSSAFQGALGSAGAGLDESLAALGSQYENQQQGQQQQLLMALLGLGLQPQFENTFQPGTPGLLNNLFGGGGLSSLLSLIGLR